MKTLLQNLQALFKADGSIIDQVDERNIVIGSDSIDLLVPVNRFPFIVVDESPDTSEEFRVTDVGRISSGTYQKLRARVFHVVVRVAVKLRNKSTALLGEDVGLLDICDNVMDVIFANPKVSGRVESLDEAIIVRRATILDGEVFVGIGREISLTYYTTDEYTF
jgi:hypothetical protein